MSEPARQLRAVGEATQTMHGVAQQALEWVKVSEERAAAAEARSEKVRAELKQRAMETLRGISAEARKRIAAERQAREQVEANLAAAEQGRELAEQGRDRSEKSFEDLQQSSQAEREKLIAHATAARKAAEKTAADAVAGVDREIAIKVAAAREEAEAEADRRVAHAAAAAAEAHESSVRLETEIERRVMEGTEDVRREAHDSVRKLVEKVEREAEEAARARAEEQLRVESDRIRVQAQRREERAREGAESEIKASASKAKREAQAAAEDTAPTWLRAESAASTAGYRTF
jgi:hypothetical protein